MQAARRILLVSIVLACANLAFASGKFGKSTKPTKPSSSRSSVSSFFTKLGVEGDDSHIRPFLAPFFSLAANAPTKSYVLDNLERESSRKPEKVIHLVMEPSDSGKMSPASAVILDAYIDDSTTLGYYYKVGLDGKLQAAIKTTAKRADGKPVRGSGVKEDLDVNSPEVQSRFQKELDYWLSGKFRKHWKPKAPVKTAQK